MDNHLLIRNLFRTEVEVEANRIWIHNGLDAEINQNQTKDIFSDKWDHFNAEKNNWIVQEFQLQWFLNLYGFNTEEHFKNYLKEKKIIVDTGSGPGFKAAWFAKLAPHAIVIGIEISDSVYTAMKKYADIPNLFFIKGDIADTGLKANSIDFIVCDQVIMHTEMPERTFDHLSEITKQGGEFACYVYSKKALPRELVDDHFRKATHNISSEEMWQFSEQLTELGKRLSELKVEFESPEISLLGIKGGKYNIQRFIYWNFLKCFWREDWGFELSKSTNYDWYAPSNAKRFSKQEFLDMIANNHLFISFFHEEEACYTGRFLKQ